MAYGFRLVGSHGVVQVDGSYQNLFVQATGTASVGSSANQGLGSIVSVALGVTLTPTSIVAISGSSAAAIVALGSTSMDVYSPYTDSRSFTWWVFDKLTAVSTSGYGWWVKKPGTLEPVFDSLQKPMRVLGSVEVPSPGFSGGLHGTSGGLTGAYTGKTLAWANMHLASTTWSGPPSGPGAVTNYYYVNCPYSSSNSMNYTTGRFTTFQGSPDTAIGTPGKLLILDVTGF